MIMRALMLALALGLGSPAVAGPFGDHCGKMVALSFVVIMSGGRRVIEEPRTSIIEAQDAEISEKSGRPRGPIKSIERAER